MEQRHGGDIYRNQVNMDFSVNTNPLGMPDSVRDALQGAIRHATEYPDQKASALYLAVEKRLCVPKEWLCFGFERSAIGHPSANYDAVLHRRVL